MSHALLTVNTLNAGYGDFQALHDVSMHVEAEEIIAIIGANGAGKSTLLHSIAGLISCDSHAVTLHNQPIGALTADKVAKSGIALVPEGRQLFPSLSVEENLQLGSMAGRRGKWNLDTVYELFPILAERRLQASTQLSGGQQQMCAIGRALMANPELILFDEISLGLAPVVVQSIYTALPGIVANGMTAIIVEQDISRALSVASRVYCLQDGRVKLEGKPLSLSRKQITDAYFGVAA